MRRVRRVSGWSPRSKSIRLIGGFGSAVAEWMVDNAVTPRAFLRFGTPDAFFKMAGEQEFARELLGLTGQQIAE